MLMDGDASFLKVDTRRPPHELEPGVAADAVNKRFEDGRAWPRYGVQGQPWGYAWVPPVFGAPVPQMSGGVIIDYQTAVTVTPGRTYLIILGNAIQVAGVQNTGQVSFTVTPPSSPIYIFTSTTVINTLVIPLSNPCAVTRFNDPNGFDNIVLVTDDWRDGMGEDGGRGRAWRVISGNAPQQIPLNGHDVWETSRLIPCFNGLALIRPGNERHYFQASAVNSTNIQLNCAPNWVTGDVVLFGGVDPTSQVQGSSPPSVGTGYYVRNISSNQVELYDTSAHALASPATTGRLDMSGGAVGRFYLERQALSPGFYGNGAPPLLMQPDASGSTVFQVGFKPVPVHLAVTADDTSAHIITVPNHRMIPGDSITYTHSNSTKETFYVYPNTPNTLSLYPNTGTGLALALAGTASTTDPSPAFNSADYIDKAGASGMPMPSGREGVYYKNRLIIVNGPDNLAISDPLDPLHYTPMSASVTANLGESDAVTCLVPQGDTLIIGKKHSILAIDNLGVPTTGAPGSNWVLREISRDYGFFSPLAALLVGADVWGFSRRGVVSIYQTEFGTLRGQATPISRDMEKYIELIDWTHADEICAATWKGRYFAAVPLKGQPIGPVLNNAVLVYNFLNEGWEGIWQGQPLTVFGLVRHTVYGEERLCFVNYYGQVCVMSDAWTDSVGAGPTPIIDKLVTRTYTAKEQGSLSMRPKIWLSAELNWDTNAPNLTVTANSPGHGEQQVMLAAQTYDKTKYLAYGQGPYNPANPNGPPSFDAPNRQDYSLSPSEMLVGALDVHQNITERLRMRMNDWGVQVIVQNGTGSCRLQSVMVAGVPATKVSSRQT